MKWLDSLFEKHKGARRLTLLWAIIIITIVTMKVFDDLTLITPAVVSAFGLVVGILATVIAFYQWMRHKDEEK